VPADPGVRAWIGEATDRAAIRADLARLADGDRTALEPAFARLQPPVLAFCRRLLGGPGAEDAAQEALLNLFAHVGEYDATRDPLPWALAFASNACRTARKRTLRRNEQADPPDRASVGDPEGALEEAELRGAVLTTLAVLSPLDAETLAQAMGERPPGATFRKRLERASARFRAQWSFP
jgi:RNA polymerase sigma-70 factor (ECF subfamily)